MFLDVCEAMMCALSCLDTNDERYLNVLVMNLSELDHCVSKMTVRGVPLVEHV